MFAFLLSKEMDPFYSIVLTYPTVIFTFFLLLTAIFWAIAAFGLLDIELLDIDVDTETGSSGVLSALLVKFGLDGVPFTIVLSFVSLFGWVTSYIAMSLVAPILSIDLLLYVVGSFVFLFSLYIGSVVSAWVVKPMKPLFVDPVQKSVKDILGQTAVVRSSIVNDQMGEAVCADGGAGLIVKVRCVESQFVKGDEVVLLSYNDDTQVFQVISPQQFLG